MRQEGRWGGEKGVCYSEKKVVSGQKERVWICPLQLKEKGQGEKN